MVTILYVSHQLLFLFFMFPLFSYGSNAWKHWELQKTVKLAFSTHWDRAAIMPGKVP